MEAEADFSSNYGYRVDPFTRAPAMHTGVDFRAEHGSPVRATAPGKVVTAEYSGGYGNMVEIEHVGGVSTRYAHMSAISVSVGQTVATGTVLGRVGSTGRSTGPHLHYETRINDEPLDPTRFLKAGARLAARG
jgi:murein DD-endopeptidase MepM/ murein hydrolase activator NlpD